MMYAAVAQMDRARASEARGREFDPPQPRHFIAVFLKYVQPALGLAKREGFVNKSDDDSDDSPLDEVSHGLCQSEFQSDV